MICSECQSKFTFKERLKAAKIPNGSITCSNCGNTFIKDERFRTLDIVVGLILDISVIVGFIYLINSIHYNLYISTILAIIIGKFFDISYMFLIQKFRIYKKCDTISV